MQSHEWVRRLPEVVLALNSEVTRLINMRPIHDIIAKYVVQKPSSVIPKRPVGLDEQKLLSRIDVRYLYQPSELEGRREATDPAWSLNVHRIWRTVTKACAILLKKIGFVREELFVVGLPANTQLPPDKVLSR